MRWARSIGLCLSLVVVLTACARPEAPLASPTAPPVTSAPPPAGGAPSSSVEAPRTKPSDDKPAPARPPAQVQREQAKVAVDQRYGDGWKLVTPLSSHAMAGPSEVRLTFSKPVRQAEVERALLEAQAAPVRGLMQWQDDRTLIWQIVELPPRLDLLLAGAHDLDGAPLPGGIPSLRVGGPPLLVEVNLQDPADLARAELPPDIISAGLSPDRLSLNLLAWKPGTTRWDWQTVDLHYVFADQAIKSGRAGTVQVRIPSDLQDWVESPTGTTLAGWRAPQPGTDASATSRGDLIVMDLRGGRRAVYEGFIRRSSAVSSGDRTSHLTWSEDGARVAVLTEEDPQTDRVNVLGLEVATGVSQPLATGIPVPATGTRLAWAPGDRFMLVGNVLVDLQNRLQLPLEGRPRDARGIWEPGGTRLLYSTADWGPVFIVDAATGQITPLGTGLAVGWSAPGRVYIIRWPASGTRYLPPGM